MPAIDTFSATGSLANPVGISGVTNEQRVVRPDGVEPPAFAFVARRSIQLSYGRTVL